MRTYRSLVPLASFAFLAACSGGGGSTPPARIAPVPSATPSATSSGAHERVTLKISIPLPPKHNIARRSPKYVSPGTLGAVLVATSTTGHGANDASYGYNLSGTGQCTLAGNAESCTLSFPLVADSYSIVVTAYDKNEDGITPGAGSPAAPIGNKLSTDAETEAVVLGADNQFNNFLLHAFVAHFELDDFGSAADSEYFGATGGTAYPNPGPTASFTAVDPDGFLIDTYGNPTSYANAPLTVTETETGDPTGCDMPCSGGKNSNGTSPGASPATITLAADEPLTLSYIGAGGVGTGIKFGNGGTPSGQGPYEGAVTATGNDGVGHSAFIVPLFAFPTSVTLSNTTAGFVWAAQAHPPHGADATNGSYAGYFGTPGTTACVDGSGHTVATLGPGTYFSGYGERYPITPGVNGSCSLTLNDGGTPADSVTVPVTVSIPGTVVGIPCAQPTGTPTGTIKRRFGAFARPADATSVGLVQYALGVGSVKLPNAATAGDTLVLLISDQPGSPNPPASFTPFANASDSFIFAYTEDVTTGGTVTVNSGDAGNNCSTALWLAEFSGSSAGAIQAANAAANNNSTTPPSIVPNAPNGIVIAGLSDDDTSASTASTGYTNYFAYSVGGSSIDVAVAHSPTTDTTDPITYTFSPADGVNAQADIFQVPPSTFSVPTISRPSARKPILKKSIRQAR